MTKISGWCWAARLANSLETSLEMNVQSSTQA
jgi:hypothetical protein